MNECFQTLSVTLPSALTDRSGFRRNASELKVLPERKATSNRKLHKLFCCRSLPLSVCRAHDETRVLSHVACELHFFPSPLISAVCQQVSVSLRLYGDFSATPLFLVSVISNGFIIVLKMPNHGQMFSLLKYLSFRNPLITPVLLL